MHTKYYTHNELHHSIKHIQLHTLLTKGEKVQVKWYKNKTNKFTKYKHYTCRRKTFYDWYLLRSSLGGLFGFGGGRSAEEKRIAWNMNMREQLPK